MPRHDPMFAAASGAEVGWFLSPCHTEYFIFGKHQE